LRRAEDPLRQRQRQRGPDAATDPEDDRRHEEAARRRARGRALTRGLSLLFLGCLTSCSLGEIFTGDRVNPEVPLWYHRPGASMQVFVHRQITAQGRTTGEDWERGRPEVDP